MVEWGGHHGGWGGFGPPSYIVKKCPAIYQASNYKPIAVSIGYIYLQEQTHQPMMHASNTVYTTYMLYIFRRGYSSDILSVAKNET